MFASVSVCVWKQWSQWKVNSSTHDTGLAWFTALTTTLNVPSLSIYHVVRHKRGTYLARATWASSAPGTLSQRNLVVQKRLFHISAVLR